MLEIAIIFLLGKFILYVYKSNKDNNAMLRGRIDSVSKDGLTYVDGNAKIRLMSNNHYAMFETLPNGSRILRDIKTGKIIKNFTQEQHLQEYKQNYQKAIKEGKTIICTGFNFHQHDKIKGARYIDINTKKLYVIRDLTRWNIPFYMDLNGNIWKPVDENYQPILLPGAEPIDILKEFNNWKKSIDQLNLSHGYYNEYYHLKTDLLYCGKEK